MVDARWPRPRRAMFGRPGHACQALRRTGAAPTETELTQALTGDVERGDARAVRATGSFLLFFSMKIDAFR